MREEEIVQIIPAPRGWYAYGQDEQGVEFLCAPVLTSHTVEDETSTETGDNG